MGLGGGWHGAEVTALDEKLPSQGQEPKTSRNGGRAGPGGGLTQDSLRLLRPSDERLPWLNGTTSVKGPPTSRNPGAKRSHRPQRQTRGGTGELRSGWRTAGPLPCQTIAADGPAAERRRRWIGVRAIDPETTSTNETKRGQESLSLTRNPPGRVAPQQGARRRTGAQKEKN